MEIPKEWGWIQAGMLIVVWRISEHHPGLALTICVTPALLEAISTTIGHWILRR